MNKKVDCAEVCVDVWGDFAMFTRPDSKVERVTYPVPTPSACRGILNAIYSKPIEFYYEIRQIDIMKPIKYITIKKNEVKTKADNSKIYTSGYFIDTQKNRTQRMNLYLKDVYYRIHAMIVIRDDAPENINLPRIVAQFNRRVSGGKCFFQPALGTRECMCFFSEPDFTVKPIDISEHIGVMLYDVFDIRNNTPLNTKKDSKEKGGVSISFFNADIKHGVIRVPAYGSDELLSRKD